MVAEHVVKEDGHLIVIMKQRESKQETREKVIPFKGMPREPASSN
jgi:hypothetical protein